MSTIFTKIINREIPGRIVFEDDLCVAFLTIEPLSPGHTLVVPRSEIDHWLAVDPALASHLMLVSQRIGRAIHEVYNPVKVGMMIAGLEVPHTHIHVTQMNTTTDLDFANADRNATPEDLDAAADALRGALSGLR